MTPINWDPRLEIHKMVHDYLAYMTSERQSSLYMCGVELLIYLIIFDISAHVNSFVRTTHFPSPPQPFRTLSKLSFDSQFVEFIRLSTLGLRVHLLGISETVNTLLPIEWTSGTQCIGRLTLNSLQRIDSWISLTYDMTYL